MLYLNTLIRGYPFGLRAGKDPRAPVLIVDGGFEKVSMNQKKKLEKSGTQRIQ